MTRRTPDEMESRRPDPVSQLAGTMFDAPASRHDDPATSHLAAASMVDEAAAQRDRIIRALMMGNLCADQTDTLYNWRTGTASRRYSELIRAGLVRVTDERRLTAAGREARVYALAGGPGAMGRAS